MNKIVDNAFMSTNDAKNDTSIRMDQNVQSVQ